MFGLIIISSLAGIRTFLPQILVAFKRSWPSRRVAAQRPMSVVEVDANRLVAEFPSKSERIKRK
jgi:hypothetical protein